MLPIDFFVALFAFQFHDGDLVLMLIYWLVMSDVSFYWFFKWLSLGVV